VNLRSAAVLLDYLLALLAGGVHDLVLHLSFVVILSPEGLLIRVDFSAIPHVVIPRVGCRDTFP
jgi:hypothetical protein